MAPSHPYGPANSARLEAAQGARIQTGIPISEPRPLSLWRLKSRCPGRDAHLVTELTAYIGRPVYNQKGSFVGTVGNVVIDLPTRKVGSLLITRTNPALIDGGRDVAVPYRWVTAVNDVVLLSTFPEHVTVVETQADTPPELATATTKA